MPYRQGTMEDLAARTVVAGLRDPLIIHVGETGSAGPGISSSARPRSTQEPTIHNEHKIWQDPLRRTGSNVPGKYFANGLILIAAGFQQPFAVAVRPDGKSRRDAHTHHIAAQYTVSTSIVSSSSPQYTLTWLAAPAFSLSK